MPGNWTVTKDARAPRQNHPGSIMTDEVFREALDRGWDKITREYYQEPFQGEQFVRFETVKRDYGKVTAYRGLHGVVPMNRDGDTMQWLTTGMAFPWEWETQNFRVATGFERTAIEEDDFGFTKEKQQELLDAHKRTVEMVIADHFNRAFGVNGSARLANDGCYYIDDDRPNPNPDAGTWSNLEATAELSEETLFLADLHASQQVGPDGTLFPQSIKKMMIPRKFKQQMWKILSTEKVLGSNHNDANWAAGAFDMADVIVYDYLNIDAIFYWLADPKSKDNELLMLKRVEPKIMTDWGLVTGNPDLLASRLRTRWGMGLGDVRKSIRGGMLVDTSET